MGETDETGIGERGSTRARAAAPACVSARHQILVIQGINTERVPPSWVIAMQSVKNADAVHLMCLLKPSLEAT